MIYVTSDLHGYPLRKFEKLLEKVNFSPEDSLYVLGDVVDRGEWGAELLLWMTQHPNTHLLLGNHEDMMLSCAYYITGRVERAGMFTRKTLDNWLMNGADPTIEGMWKLGSRDPALVDGILNMIRKAPLYQCLTVNGREFVLVHGGLGNFSPEKPLEDYGASEILWARPGPDTRYYEDKTVIFGHTPTVRFGSHYRGRAVVTDTWICIDTGAAFGYGPMLLRLDDMAQIYLDT